MIEAAVDYIDLSLANTFVVLLMQSGSQALLYEGYSI
jgi:hypothetical protein